jgi:8-hydroxy-5-deazaflavin:NADPH oxidoreductase
MIGGAGALGTGLARRWVNAGYSLIIGSRNPARAQDAAAALPRPEGSTTPVGTSYTEAAASADILVLTVPFAHHAETLDEIRQAARGKLILDTTVPLVDGNFALVQLPEAGSAAVAAQRRLEGVARVVSAFHNVAARQLQHDAVIDCDVLVFGNDAADRWSAIGLVEAAGLRGVHGGPLANSAAAEALASVLIGINRNYKVNGAGLRITGLD